VVRGETAPANTFWENTMCHGSYDYNWNSCDNSWDSEYCERPRKRHHRKSYSCESSWDYSYCS
jgi:hypothetical protein